MPLDNCITTCWGYDLTIVLVLPFVCVVAYDQKFRRWATAVNVKLMLPPRQSRGVSRSC